LIEIQLLIFNLVIQILTAERHTGTQQNDIYWQVAKQLYYNNNISKSKIKIKTTCEIIEMEKYKNHTNRGTELINMDVNLDYYSTNSHTLSIITF